MKNNNQKLFDNEHPRVFISYSWEDEAHGNWIEEFATRLRKDGIDVYLDRWDMKSGDRLTVFMEQIKEYDYIFLICTPNYKLRFDSRKGGVGYEANMITEEILYEGNERKFIPILRKSEWQASSPTFVRGKKYLDFRDDFYEEKYYTELLDAVYNRSRKPLLGSQGSETRRLDLLRDLQPDSDT